MTTSPQAGLVDHQDYDLPGAVMASWDAFLAAVDDVDLATKTRLSGWNVREIAVHLGTWDGTSALTQALDSLGHAEDAKPEDPDAVNSAVVEAHRDASDDEVRAALKASRDATADFLASDTAKEHGHDLVGSVLGALPLLTVVHAGCYELAIHALDVADAVDADTDPALLAHGVAALVDSTGALAARASIETTVSVVADEGGWAFTSTADKGWTFEPVSGKGKGGRVSGSAQHLLEAASGRSDAAWLVARRQLKVGHVPSLMALVPIIDQVPSIPGSLKVAARSINGVGSLLGHHRD